MCGFLPNFNFFTFGGFMYLSFFNYFFGISALLDSDSRERQDF